MVAWIEDADVSKDDRDALLARICDVEFKTRNMVYAMTFEEADAFLLALDDMLEKDWGAYVIGFRTMVNFVAGLETSDKLQEAYDDYAKALEREIK